MSRKKHNMDDTAIPEIERLISEWIHNKKYREILRLKLIDDETYDTIAEMYEMSVPQIKTIVYTSIVILYEHKGET